MKLLIVLCLSFALAVASAPLQIARSGYFYENALDKFAADLKALGLEKGLLGAASNDTVCWKNTYGRGVGNPVTACASGLQRDGFLCYPYCKSGYYGVGPVCWQYCKPTYTDEGALCGRNAQIISADNSACPWYDKCGLTFAKGCSKCPSGFSNDGCTCRIDVSVYAKDSYGRGAGSPMGCTSSQQEDAALCYPYCKAAWDGVGPVCWQQCSSTFPINSGAICCKTQQQCNDSIVEISKGVLAAVAAAVEAGEGDGDAMDAFKKAIEAITGFILPLCY